MKHFTINELCATSHPIPNNPTQDIKHSLEELVHNVLDPARETFGSPIRVNSGYRCDQLNKAVRGAASSQHLKGEAADLTTGSTDGNRRLFEIIKARGVFDQLIDEKNFSWVHV
ncbi:MAG: D-Ala-D-Ala carboxypeptidase family metallohydrolase, partial [Mucinivorans sp.]